MQISSMVLFSGPILISGNIPNSTSFIIGKVRPKDAFISKFEPRLHFSSFFFLMCEPCKPQIQQFWWLTKLLFFWLWLYVIILVEYKLVFTNLPIFVPLQIIMPISTFFKYFDKEYGKGKNSLVNGTKDLFALNSF